MKGFRTVTILALLIIILATIAALTGILSREGPGEFYFQSVHGETIRIYGKGIYQNMSTEVAVQGIAHDYVTLFIAIPLLIIALLLTKKGSYRGRFLLAGVVSFFLVTYLFYTVMGTFNPLFLVYVSLTALSFFSLTLILISFRVEEVPSLFKEKSPTGLIGGFLIFQAVMVALLWLSIIIPSLLDGTIIPRAVEHYTTLVVQGLDLGLLLPIAFVAGVLLINKRPYGYLVGSVFMIFLAILMTALTGKIISQLLIGIDVGYALVFIPMMNLISIICAVIVIWSLKPEKV